MTCKLRAYLVDIITRIIGGHHNSQITPVLGLRAMQDLKNVGLSSTAKRRQKTGMLFSRHETREVFERFTEPTSKNWALESHFFKSVSADPRGLGSIEKSPRLLVPIDACKSLPDWRLFRISPPNAIVSC